MKPKDLATTAVLVALASVLHAVEAMIPLPYVMPGAKLGLANIVSVYGVMTLGLNQVMAISFLRTLLGGLLSGTLLSFGYYLSVSGALASAIVMFLVSKAVLFGAKPSVVGVSVAGAFTHNLSQLLTAALLMRQAGVFFYLPYLLFFAIPTGIFVGLVTRRLLSLYPHLAKANREP